MKALCLFFILMFTQLKVHCQTGRFFSMELQTGATGLMYLDPIWKPITNFSAMIEPEARGMMQLNMYYTIYRKVDFGVYFNHSSMAANRTTLKPTIEETSSKGKMSLSVSGLKVNLYLLNIKQSSFGLTFSHSLWLSKPKTIVTMTYHKDSVVPGVMYATPVSNLNFGFRYLHGFKAQKLKLSSEIITSKYNFTYPPAICKSCSNPYPRGGGWHPYGFYLNFNIGINYYFNQRIKKE